MFLHSCWSLFYCVVWFCSNAVLNSNSTENGLKINEKNGRRRSPSSYSVSPPARISAQEQPSWAAALLSSSRWQLAPSLSSLPSWPCASSTPFSSFLSSCSSGTRTRTPPSRDLRDFFAHALTERPISLLVTAWALPFPSMVVSSLFSPSWISPSIENFPHHRPHPLRSLGPSKSPRRVRGKFLSHLAQFEIWPVVAHVHIIR